MEEEKDKLVLKAGGTAGAKAQLPHKGPSWKEEQEPAGWWKALGGG